MKSFRKVICTVIAMLLCLTPLLACQRKGNKTPSASTDTGVKAGTTVYAGNGRTDYKIVLSTDAGEDIKLAADEINYFTGLAASVTLDTISDSFAVYSESSKYIVLGNNRLSNLAGITLGEEYGRSGYIIKSVGNMVFITGCALDTTNYATVQGAYAFLYHTLGLKIYSGDTWTYNEASSYTMPVFDVSSIPDIDRRYASYYFNDNLEAMRMMQTPPRYGDEHYSMEAHSQFRILSQTSEYLSHPDWTSGTSPSVALCYSAKDMYPVFAKNVINLLEANPTVIRAFLGVEDMVTQCTCARCVAMMEEYHTNHAGLMLYFLNEVLNIVVPYMEENHPGRHIEFATFPYEGVLDPPVTFNDATGEIMPNHKDIFVHPSLHIQVATLRINNMYSILDTPNKAIYDNFRGWAYLANGRLECYLYNYYTSAVSVSSGTFLHYQETMKALKDLGLYYFYEEGPFDQSQFAQLKVYVQSRLALDLSQSYDALAHDFCHGYYGPAGDVMCDLYDYFAGFYASNRANMPGDYATSTNTIYSEAFMPRAFLEAELALLDKAERALEGLKTTDPEKYEKYLWNVRKESFDVRLNRLQAFSTEMPVADVLAEVEMLRGWCTKFRGGRSASWVFPNSRGGTISQWLDDLVAKLN